MRKDDDPDFSLERYRNEGRVEKKKAPNRQHIMERTMHALSVSEKFTEFLCAKLDSTRQLLASSKSSEDDPTPSGTKRYAESPEQNGRESKRAKQENGSIKPAGSSYINSQGFSVCKRQPKLLEGAVMRDYQLDGLDWLMVLDVNGASGILADEMGLGKTLQVIAFFSFLIEVNSGKQGPFLIIAPLSTLHNWVAEFKKFAPKLPVILYHGNKKERSLMYPDIKKKIEVHGHITYPIVVTSYEMPLNDAELRKFHWRYLVVDEGHRLKNHQCLLVRELRQYNTVGRLLLTGTPLQNNLTELWSLLNFVLPDVINDLDVFESWFDSSALLTTEGGESIVAAEEKDQVLTTLHKILKPFLLRRIKADVALSIPPKKEFVVYARMTDLQRRIYAAIVDKVLESQEENHVDFAEAQNRSESKSQNGKLSTNEEINQTFNQRCLRPRVTNSNNLENNMPFRNRGAVVSEINDDDWLKVKSKSQYIATDIFRDLAESNEEIVVELKMKSPVMALRKVCNHPYLVSYPVIPGTKELKIDERLVERSGKLIVLDALLKRLKNNGHKVLIFSNFKQMLDILEDYLLLREYQFVRLDGSRSLGNRQENIKEFTDNPDVFVFLISTRAGGLGINLVSADTVIIVDSDWNPQADLQAQDRCHRIGQTHPVAVYRLVIEGSIDEKIVKRAETKRKLEKAVIQSGKFKNFRDDEQVNIQELRDLLNSTDQHTVGQSNGCVYTDLELDSLCDRKLHFPDWEETQPR